MDLEITDKFKKILEKQGLKFRLNTSVINARVTGKSVDLELKKNDEKKTEVLKCNKVLVATGRIPNTESLGLKEIGVKLDKNVGIFFVPWTFSSCQVINDQSHR